jgi:hypothetical protein
LLVGGKVKEKHMKDEAQNSVQRELTYGEKAVGLTFNPSNDPNVQRIKEQFAAVIDTLSELRGDKPNTESPGPDAARMLSVAITEAQTAQMWAVKAVTWR